MFLWKACHDILPSKSTLKRRFHGNGSFGDQCPRCGEDAESIEHILFFCSFSFICWYLWKYRNAFIFSSSVESPIEVWNKSQLAFYEFLSSSFITPDAKEEKVKISGNWKPPDLNVVKINCDASVDLVSGKACVAAVIRDEH
ncbi:hypothetical protein V6N13_039052 [Hibiscus sabdariffa]